jgi:hypothetical protein
VPIQFFSGHQDDVFIPALLVVLVGVAIVAVPVIAWTRVVKMRQRRAILLLTGIVAVATVVVALVLALPGFGVLHRQDVAVRAAIETQYGIALSQTEASDLVDGDSLLIPKVGFITSANGDPVLKANGKPLQDEVRLAHHKTLPAGVYRLETTDGDEVPRKS